MYKYLLIIILFSGTAFGKNLGVEATINNGQKSPCHGKGDVSIQKLVLTKDEKYPFCKTVTSVRIFDLVMYEGSFFTIHPLVSQFEMRIGNGVFYGRNGIVSEAQFRGRPGPNITVSVSRTKVKFPPTTIKYLTHRPQAGASQSLIIALSRFETQQRVIKIRKGVGILIDSMGSRGTQGAPGASGNNAIQKECSGYNGQEPTPGTNGGIGNSGTKGGDISAKFILVSNQRQINDLDIQLASTGGEGGYGGFGGKGGEGAPGLVCEVFGQRVGNRSGFNKAPNGLSGANGRKGSAGKIKLTIEVIKSLGDRNMHGSIEQKASSKYHEEVEAREFNPETCERMRNNWSNIAEAWCSDSGGIDQNNTNQTCVNAQDSPPFTKVYGTITCQN